MARPFEGLINRVADRQKIPRAVGQALVDTENSKRNPSLVIKETYGGGSYGLSMVTLKTAQQMGFSGPTGNLNDPETNLTFGFKYLRQMFDGPAKANWYRAAAAYNAGPDLEPWPAKYVARFREHLLEWEGKREFPKSSAPEPGAPSQPWWALVALSLTAIVTAFMLKRKVNP